MWDYPTTSRPAHGPLRGFGLLSAIADARQLLLESRIRAPRSYELLDVLLVSLSGSALFCPTAHTPAGTGSPGALAGNGQPPEDIEHDETSSSKIPFVGNFDAV